MWRRSFRAQQRGGRERVADCAASRLYHADCASTVFERKSNSAAGSSTAYSDRHDYQQHRTDVWMGFL